MSAVRSLSGDKRTLDFFISCICGSVLGVEIAGEDLRSTKQYFVRRRALPILPNYWSCLGANYWANYIANGTGGNDEKDLRTIGCRKYRRRLIDAEFRCPKKYSRAPNAATRISSRPSRRIWIRPRAREEISPCTERTFIRARSPCPSPQTPLYTSL